MPDWQHWPRQSPQLQPLKKNKKKTHKYEDYQNIFGVADHGLAAKQFINRARAERPRDLLINVQK